MSEPTPIPGAERLREIADLLEADATMHRATLEVAIERGHPEHLLAYEREQHAHYAAAARDLRALADHLARPREGLPQCVRECVMTALVLAQSSGSPLSADDLAQRVSNAVLALLDAPTPTGDTPDA